MQLRNDFSDNSHDLAWNATKWPIVRIGGLPIAVLDRRQTARTIIDRALARRGSNLPALCHTSANGHVIAMCDQDPGLRRMYESSEMINADGTPMVFVSRWLTTTPLPERVATTDLFHDVAALAQQREARFYFLGASEASNRAAVREMRRQYPQLAIVGRRNGYFSRAEEQNVIDDINAAAPDILWLSLGAPREQLFAIRNRDRLRDVGVIKTSGGLFDFLSGACSRAPGWMQDAGLEWLYRVWLEPRRLFLRYLLTNPHASLVMLRQSGDLRPARREA